MPFPLQRPRFAAAPRSASSSATPARQHCCWSSTPAATRAWAPVAAAPRERQPGGLAGRCGSRRPASTSRVPFALARRHLSGRTARPPWLSCSDKPRFSAASTGSRPSARVLSSSASGCAPWIAARASWWRGAGLDVGSWFGPAWMSTRYLMDREVRHRLGAAVKCRCVRARRRSRRSWERTTPARRRERRGAC